MDRRVSDSASLARPMAGIDDFAFRSAKTREEIVFWNRRPRAILRTNECLFFEDLAEHVIRHPDPP